MTDDINYLEEVNRKIGYASILSKIPESNHKLAIELLNKRDVIKEKNNICHGVRKGLERWFCNHNCFLHYQKGQS